MFGFLKTRKLRTIKTFEVYAISIIKGVFISQTKCERIGEVKARDLAEAQRAAELLYSNMGRVHVEGYMGH